MAPSGGSFRQVAVECLQKGLWTVLDQGCATIGNFVVMVLLARQVPPASFGSFTVIMALFMACHLAFASLVVEPMMIYASRDYRNRLTIYFRHLLVSHLAYSMVVAVGFGLTGLGTAMWGQSEAMVEALFGFAIYTPAALLLFLVRRACTVMMVPHLATAGSVLYLLLLWLGIALLMMGWGLTIFGALFVSMLAGLLASLFLIVALRPRAVLLENSEHRDGPEPLPLPLPEMLRMHASVGLWLTGGQLAVWVMNDFGALVLAAHSGLPVVGQLRAVTILVLPILHSLSALRSIILPILVRRADNAEFAHIFRLALFGMWALTSLYGLGLLFVGESVIRILYNGRYSTAGLLLWAVAAIPVVVGSFDLFMVGLVARRRAEACFYVGVTGAVTLVPAAALLIPSFAINGVFLAQILCFGTAALFAALWLLRLVAGEPSLKEQQGIQGRDYGSEPDRPGYAADSARLGSSEW